MKETATMSNTILYALTVMIWGSTWYAITFQLGEVHPLLSIAYRFGLAAIVLFVFLALRGRMKYMRFTKQQHFFIALQGFFLFCLNYWLNYVGTGYLPSGLVSVVFSTLTMMNILNQWVFFKIRVKKQVILGSLTGLIGITMVFWPEIDKISLGDTMLRGLLLVLAASYTASLGNMVALRNTRDSIPVIEGNSFGMMYGAGFSFLLALAAGAPLTFSTQTPYLLSLLYLAVFGSAIAFGTYLTLLRNIGADKAAYAGIMFPIVALAISTFLEGYIWTPLSVIGVAITLLGNLVAMTNRENLLHWRERFRK